MRGNITRRGKSSWRIKFDLDNDPVTGERRTRVVTVRGKRHDAERELTRLLNEADKGTLVDASKATVADYLRSWLDGQHDLSPVSVERYREIIEVRAIPAIGHHELQKLKPEHVKAWVSGMRTAGSRTGGPLAPRTVKHALLMVSGALKAAVEIELVSRNVAAVVKAPKPEDTEVVILTAEQITAVLASMAGNRLCPIVSLALATGMRRGELLALRWQDVDLGRSVLKVERSLEQTKAGLRFKAPKTKHGRRTISLPASAVSMLGAHRKEQLELRLQLGMGKHEPDALVFCNHDGSPISPNYFSIMWGRAIAANAELPQVTFHALRHSHASALIAAGIDVVTVSRRLGHATPVITLTAYAHLFADTDTKAADAIEKVLG